MHQWPHARPRRAPFQPPPTKPVAPVTKTLTQSRPSSGDGLRTQRAHPGRTGLQPTEVGVDHHLDELSKLDLGSQPSSRRARRVAHQVVHLGRPVELRVHDDVILVVQPDARERDPAERREPSGRPRSRRRKSLGSSCWSIAHIART